jgi:hypothetical protein
VVAGVEADHRAVTERSNLHVVGSPVGNLHLIERRLEEFVLEHESLVLADPLVNLRERVSEAVLTSAHVVLARVVGSVGEPDLQVARSCLVHDIDAIEVVVNGILADLRVGVGDAPELVILVLESVPVGGPEHDASLDGMLREIRVSVDLVPRDVQSDRRGESRVPVHLRGV